MRFCRKIGASLADDHGNSQRADFHRPVYPVDKVKLDKWFKPDEIARAKEMMKGKWGEVLARTGR
jgi:hypothetical protein